MERFFADRVTTMYVAPSMDDEIVVHEVTQEPLVRKMESVDFQTLAWCPDDKAAKRIALALNVLAEVEEWREGDEKERTPAGLLHGVFDLLDHAALVAGREYLRMSQS